MRIKEVKARKIFDSNGNRAIEVEVVSDVNTGRACIGAGTSTGTHEVVAYPEDIKKVVNLVNKVFSKDLKGVQINSFGDLEKIERYVRGHDFSDNFEKIGGNVLVNLELAALKASSEDPLFKVLRKKKIKKMPMPLGNCIGGGKHSGGKGPDFQEFLVLPRVKKFSEAMEINTTMHKELKDELKKRDRARGKRLKA